MRRPRAALLEKTPKPGSISTVNPADPVREAIMVERRAITMYLERIIILMRQPGQDTECGRRIADLFSMISTEIKAGRHASERLHQGPRARDVVTREAKALKDLIESLETKP